MKLVDEDYSQASDEELTYWDILELDPIKDEKTINTYRERERTKFNDKYGLLMIEGQACVVYRERNQGVGQCETKYAKPAAIKQFCANQKIPFVIKPVRGAPYIKWEPIFDDWMNRPDRRTYTQPVFKPVCGLLATEAMPNHTSDYNTFIGAQFEPVKGDCNLILSHIKNVWCSNNDIYYQYVINWFARMIQQPNTQGRTVIVLRSGEGGGKNIILDLFDDYYGSHSSLCSKPEALTGFNAHLATSVFVFLNESLWGGDKKNIGSFKTLVTDSKLTVEQKFIPEFKAKNNTHILVATNNDWAVPVGLDDRRFFMLDLDTLSKDQRGSKYFKALASCIDDGGREAFIYHLMNEINLTDFDVSQMPVNNSESKLDHKMRGADNVTSWWLDVLIEGGFYFTADLKDGQGKIDHFHEWPVNSECAIISKLAYESYLKNTRAHQLAHNVVSRKIAKLLDVEKIPTKRRSHDPRLRQYILPPLSKARIEFEKQVKQSIDWDE